ncbi:MAG TPA: carboxypeptidase-like regulatory domain-containing protein [Candidatus Rifleibacterium sp.]|nr:carboxypeptidase-like regulatory domain-containing protein [Candidatus Rifleibacterium sp.]HPT47006.1 carboxypeptidase-like regulatory domain-containing protein [Candidatus Rifleibacterium sp.]
MSDGKFYGLVVLFCLAIMLPGCSGGGSSPAGVPVQTESPETAVSRLFASWQTGSAPVFAINNDGSIAAQTTATDRYINFRDLSGNQYKLKFLDVVYASDFAATVNTQYTSELNVSIGGLKIGFNMLRESGAWYLGSLTVTELPVVVVEQNGIKGVVTDTITRLPISGARVEAFNSTTGVFIKYAVTDSVGFYQILELPPGSYYLVINRAGYEPYTLTGISVS